MTEAKSATIEFLRKQSVQLHRSAARAKHYFLIDPKRALTRPRQFAELMAQDDGA